MEAGHGRWQMEGEAGEPSDLQGSFQLGKLFGSNGCRSEEANCLPDRTSNKTKVSLLTSGLRAIVYPLKHLSRSHLR